MNIDEMVILTPACRPFGEVSTCPGAYLDGDSKAEHVEVAFNVGTPVIKSTIVIVSSNIIVIVRIYI